MEDVVSGGNNFVPRAASAGLRDSEPPSSAFHIHARNLQLVGCSVLEPPGIWGILQAP